MTAAARCLPEQTGAARADADLCRDIRRGGVHIWVLRPDDGEVRAALESIAFHVPDHERRTLSRIGLERVRTEKLLSRALLRSTLSRYTGIAPPDIPLDRDDFGKPRLSDAFAPEPLCFNLSHTDGLLACAVSCFGRIGIDVEHRSVDARTEAACMDHFTVVERLAVEQSRRSGPVSRFTDFWTLKEAGLKAVGVGLSQGGINAAFDFIGENGLRADLGVDLFGAGDRWSFTVMEPGPGYRCALARHGPRLCSNHIAVYQGLSRPLRKHRMWRIIAEG